MCRSEQNEQPKQLSVCGVHSHRDFTKRARGVPLGMSKIRQECPAPDLSAAHVLLREEPDEEDDDEEEEDDDDGEEDGDDNEDDDEGYSP